LIWISIPSLFMEKVLWLKSIISPSAAEKQ